MNYENASDFQLNVRLACLTVDDELGVEKSNVVTDAIDIVNDKMAIIKTVNYCTDWNATMPLAVKYGVTPVLDDGYGYATTKPYEIYEPHGLNADDGFFAVEIDHDTTPLRAIVICLIKVLESK